MVIVTNFEAVKIIQYCKDAKVKRMPIPTRARDVPQSDRLQQPNLPTTTP